MTIIEKLDSMKACSPAIKWVRANSITTLEQAWAECRRGDWMLWLAFSLGVQNTDKRLFVLAKARCAETVRHLMKDKRSTDALDVTIRYGLGQATDEELKAAAADAANAAYAAVYAAVAAIANAVAIAAAYAAVYAANAANAIAAATVAANATKRLLTANICRELLTDVIKQLL